MKLSISVVDFAWPDGPASIGPRVGRIARTADQAGFDSIWVMDHLFQIGMNGPAEDPMLEGYATLGFMAGQTERIRLGTLVTAVSYRSPGLLVKTVTTLDVLSQGRAWLGIGAAWNGQEASGLGLSFPPTKQRYEQLEETLRIAHQMWAGDTSAFEGGHFTLDNPLNNPNTLQTPHPPILIGGSGERKTLRLVAQYADACNLFDIPEGVEMGHMTGGKAGLLHKLDVLRAHCEAVGRPYDEIEKTIASGAALPGSGRDNPQSPQQLVDHYGELAELGFEHVIFGPVGPWTEADLDLYASIVPEVTKL
jgi:F420-dependent oxidoreductase-like protein